MAESTTAFDGFGSLLIGYNSVTELNEDGPINETNAGLDLEIRGSVAVPLGAQYGAQFDAEMTRSTYHNSYEGETGKISDTTIAAHGFWRGNKALVGALVQRTVTAQPMGYDGPTIYLGGEAQAYAGRVTVYGQAAYGFDDGATYYGSLEGRETGNYALKLRYFPKDNLLVGVKVVYDHTHFTNYDDGVVKTWTVGGNAEYRLPHSRFSVLANVDYRDIKENWGGYLYDGRGWRAMAGVKINFGAKSLFERDRSGASLDPVRSPNTDCDPL